MKVIILIICLIPLVSTQYDKCVLNCMTQWSNCSRQVNATVACKCLQQVADCFINNGCYDSHNHENVLAECINLNCNIPACSKSTSSSSQSTDFNIHDIIVIIIISLIGIACL
jgi:hypothetical protein